mmetsp:Transcript_71350/g.167041  ORF Transcript_71350/g.167041 Transcript_71350/m.167041 type:complete len:247 (-) Transcript_71350:187-927(-)
MTKFQVCFVNAWRDLREKICKVRELNQGFHRNGQCWHLLRQVYVQHRARDATRQIAQLQRNRLCQGLQTTIFFMPPYRQRLSGLDHGMQRLQEPCQSLLRLLREVPECFVEELPPILFVRRVMHRLHLQIAQHLPRHISLLQFKGGAALLINASPFSLFQEVAQSEKALCRGKTTGATFICCGKGIHNLHQLLVQSPLQIGIILLAFGRLLKLLQEALCLLTELVDSHLLVMSLTVDATLRHVLAA